MPGLSVDYRVAGSLLPVRARWDAALEACRGDAPARQATLLEDDCCRIGSHAHDRYPIETREEAGLFIALEGRIYSGWARPPLEELMALAALLAAGAHDATTIGTRVRAWDGEYTALVYSRADRRLWMFSDALGRLPLYAAADARGLSVSRDQRFLLDHEGLGVVDRVGIAQLLLFGFPLGRHTLVQGIERVPAGQGFHASPHGVRVIDGLGEPLDLEDKARAGLAPEHNAGDLAELFTAGCRIRADAGDPPLLALSGGLDSRAVGAGLVRAGRPFDAFTLRDHAGVYAHETPIARKLAAMFDAPWRSFQAPASRRGTLQRMLEMKSGLNSLAMGFSLPIFEMLHRSYGTGRTYWSGDGGDKVLPDHRPGLPGSGRADLAGYLIHSRPLWPAAMVARLTGVGEEELRAGVEQVIGRYPERSADQRFVRFHFTERAFRWIFEGEDCNRHYYWTVAPFFERDFLRAAFACPDDQKSGHRLYRDFLHRLHPAVNAIRDANLGLAMDSPAYAWSRRLRETARRFPRLRHLLRQGMPQAVPQAHPRSIGALLRGQLEHSEPVRACFSVPALADVAASPGSWSDAALDCLVTATCACEIIMGRCSSLSELVTEGVG